MSIFCFKKKPWLIWVLLPLVLYAATAFAEVEKTIQITSQPPGAEVFLLQGRKETSLGKTPLKYGATFHSEKSVLRVKLKKPGYDDKVVKLKGADSKVSVNLKAFQYTASPQDYKDEKLKNAQKKINPVVDKYLPKLIGKKGHFQYRLNGPVKTVSLGGTPYASLPIYLEDLGGKFNKKGKDRQIELLQELWRQFGHDVAIPLAAHLKGKGIGGLILKIYFDDQKFLFGVSSHFETNTEMVCEGGTEMQSNYNPCKYYDASRGGCQGGYEMQSVYNPCIRRVPRTTTSLVLDPNAATTRGKASATFLLSAKHFSQKELPFNQVPYILIDSKGNILNSMGEFQK